MRFGLGLATALASLGAVAAQPDWGTGEVYRIHPGAHEAVTNQAKLYTKLEGDSYWFKIVPRSGKQVFESTLYFNLDQDPNTDGSPENGPGAPAGYEMYAFITPAGAEFFSGCAPYNGDACRTSLSSLPATGSSFTVLADNSTEFSVPQDFFGGARDIDIAVVLQSRLGLETPDAEFGPPFLLNYYTMYSDIDTYLATACATKQVGELRGAVLFDDLAEDNFFFNKSYVQLAIAMQHQVRQAGMPQDMIRLPDLLNVANACKFSAIIVPSLTFIELSQWAAVKKAVFLLTQVYGVGFVTGGEFLTNGPDRAAVPGDPYFAMSALLGVKNDNPVGAQVATNDVKISSTAELFWDKANGDLIMDTTFAGQFTSYFIPTPGSSFTSTIAAEQHVTGDTGAAVRNAVILSENDANIFGRKSGRIAHFATAAIMTNKDLVWRALQWMTVRDSNVQLSLLMSRFEGGIFTCRNDMDQSRFADESIIVEPELYRGAIKPWYDNYNFVASYYINIGNNESAREFTNWTWAKEVYGQYIGLENEIGSHSYTHPYDISSLPPQELEFEFLDSMNEIVVELGLARIASAQPGNPEDLRTAQAMEAFMPETYFSGGFSGVNAGYPGVFGYLNPESDMVYVAPNMKFDFSLKILGKTPAEMEAIWIQEFNDLNSFANSQVYHWPIHDYAVTEWDDTTFTLGGDNSYSKESMENLIKHVFANKAEFITTLELSDRIRTNKAAKLITSVVSENQITATVTIPTIADELITLGHHALQLEHPSAPRSIVSVTNHFAYNDKRVLVPASGGTFEVTFGTDEEAQANVLGVTHITDIGMRMELVSVVGDGKVLTFTVRGKGEVTVMQSVLLERASTTISHVGGTYTENWTNRQDSRGLTFTFDSDNLHTVEIKLGAAPTAAPGPPPYATDNSCATRCSNIQARWYFWGVSIDQNCQVLPLQGANQLHLCDCDLSIAGALNADGSINMETACPTIANAPESYWDRIFQRKSRKYQNACAQLCATDQDCSRWTLNRRTNTCSPIVCTGRYTRYNFGSKYVSGTPCQR